VALVCSTVIRFYTLLGMRLDCRWLDAARYGKLHSMKALLKTSGAYKATLVAYNGTGTSYGLMGHTALHWAAAKVNTSPLLHGVLRAIML